MNFFKPFKFMNISLLLEESGDYGFFGKTIFLSISV